MRHDKISQKGEEITVCIYDSTRQRMAQFSVGIEIEIGIDTEIEVDG